MKTEQGSKSTGLSFWNSRRIIVQDRLTSISWRVSRFDSHACVLCWSCGSVVTWASSWSNSDCLIFPVTAHSSGRAWMQWSLEITDGQPGTVLPIHRCEHHAQYIQDSMIIYVYHWILVEFHTCTVMGSSIHQLCFFAGIPQFMTIYGPIFNLGIWSSSQSVANPSAEVVPLRASPSWRTSHADEWDT